MSLPSTTDPERPPTRQLFKEAAIFGAVGTVIAVVAATYLANRQRLFGGFGDSEQLIWHARNLVHVLRTGDPIIRDAYFGIEVPYAYMPTSFGVAGFVALVRVITGDPWLGLNLGIFLGFVANFVSAFVCLRLLNVSRKAAALGAWVFMLAPQTVTQGLSGHMWYSWTFLIPPFLLLITRAGRAIPTGRWWLWLGVMAGLFFWVNEYFWVLAAIVTMIAGAITLVRKRPIEWRWIAAGVAAFLILTGPGLWLHYERWQFDRTHAIEVGRSSKIAAAVSSDPADYLQPSELSPLYLDLPGALTQAYEETNNYLGLIGLLALATAAILALRKQLPEEQARFLLRSAPVVLFTVLVSFGPFIPTDGRFPGLVGFFYRYEVFPFNQIAGWTRFGVFAVTWVAMVVAFVAHWLFAKLRRELATVLLVLLAAVVVVDQYPFFDTVTHDAPVPAGMLRAIETSPEDEMVVHLPLDGVGQREYNATAQFFQTFHQRPIVNGYMPVINPEYLELMSEAPIACLTTHDWHPCPEVGIIGDYISNSDIGWVVFERSRLRTVLEKTREDPFVLAQKLQGIRAFLEILKEQGVLTSVYSDADYELLRVDRR